MIRRPTRGEWVGAAALALVGVVLMWLGAVLCGQTPWP